MNGVTVINQILDSIVKGGKRAIRDKFIDTQKVPPYVGGRTDSLNIQAVCHAGYQLEPAKRNCFFSMSKDPQPKNIQIDKLGPVKAKIQKQKIVNSKVSSPTKNKKGYRSFSFSGLKSNRYKSGGFSPIKDQTKKKQKQNCFIKLEEDNRNRIVVERVKLRESMQEDKIRTQKQKQLLKQYQQKKANEIFEKERMQRQLNSQKLLNQHIAKGGDHHFYFNQTGQAVLFVKQGDSLGKSYPKSMNCKIQSQECPLQQQEIIPTDKRSSRKRFQANKKSINDFEVANEHQRIRSARGEAFASAVLKTVNLSRISVNQSLRQLDIQEFMKRNDLFNNNHTRQTTSIPYIEPKTGTVYTQLSTNQVLRDSQSIAQQQSDHFKSESTKSRPFTRRKSYFEPFKNNKFSAESKTQRPFYNQEKNNNQESFKIQTRPLRTADGGTKRSQVNERRPRTSEQKGRITTANQNLVLALLQ